MHWSARISWLEVHIKERGAYDQTMRMRQILILRQVLFKEGAVSVVFSRNRKFVDVDDQRVPVALQIAIKMKRIRGY